MNVLSMTDFYKTDHRRQYPDGTEYVYSNFTPRNGKHALTDEGGIIFFGLQGFIKEFLVEQWNENFFKRPLNNVRAEYQRRLDTSLGKNSVTTEHIEQLWLLGYLPIEIKALPEGSFVPYGVPCLTIINTRPQFFWVTNFLESIMSAELWRGCTSATTSFAYKKRFVEHSKKTGSPRDFVEWQGHDFSFRGMGGVHDAMKSGAAHLTCFKGTDTIPAIDYIEDWYNCRAEDHFIGGSVPATEHSVMCMGGDVDELETFRRLITKTYPKGIVSIVSDTWDLWKVCSEYLPKLREDIYGRDGRVVIRPDSGDPVDIICGTCHEIGKGETPEEKGVYEILWDVFGGRVNEYGYKVLDTHIGCIYGDSITLERQDMIIKRLEEKGFCASNLVLGIGSYTFVYCTRDSHGFAMKATWGQVRGEPIEIYKDPVTDDGVKKSAKGLLRVDYVGGKFRLRDQVTKDESDGGALERVFFNSVVTKQMSFEDIRKNIDRLIEW